MDRRLFLASGVVGGMAAIAGCSEKACEPSNKTSASRKTRHLRLVTSWPKNFPGLGTAPEKFAQRVNQLTQGELNIKVYGAGEIVPALEVFDAVSQGTVQIGHSAAYYWKGKLPSAPFFTAVPFGMTAQEQNGWLHFGGGLELWQSLYEPHNLIPFAGGNTGVQMAGWFNKKIETVSDIRGLKMRIPGLAGEVWKRLGGTPVTLPGGELFTALQTGAIDASEWVGPYNDLAFGFHKVAKYYYYPGWHEPSATLEIIVNREAFLELPEDHQEAIAVAARAANQEMLDEYTTRNAIALQELVKTHNVEVLPLPEAVLAALKTESEKLLLELAEGDETLKAVYESYVQYQQSVMANTKITEQAYLTQRET